MKKKMLLAMLVISALIIISNVNAECCINPGAPPIMICTEIAEGDCCPADTYLEYYTAHSGPTTVTECKNSFSVSGSCNAKDACIDGCCCYAEVSGEFTEAGIITQSECDSYQGIFDVTIATPEGCISTCGALGPEIPSEMCTNPAPQIISENIMGEKAVKVSWEDWSKATPCQPESFTISRCNGTACQNFIELATTADSVLVYDDDSPSLRWNKIYTYKVTAHYDTGSFSNTSKVELGDMECWYHYDATGFCIVNMTYEMEPYKPYLVSYGYNGFQAGEANFRQKVQTRFENNFNRPFHCDAQNKLIVDGDACPSGQICAIRHGATDYCIVETVCRTSGMPFNLFNTKEKCEVNYCFFDRSYTNVNDCYDCMPYMSCYDYKSEAACKTDNCGVGNNCTWRYTNVELGIGVCADTSKDNCRWCDLAGTPGMQNLEAYNYVFDRCTQKRVNALSTDKKQCEYVPRGPVALISFE